MANFKKLVEAVENLLAYTVDPLWEVAGRSQDTEFMLAADEPIKEVRDILDAIKAQESEEHRRLDFAGVEVTIYTSPVDGTPVIEIDTPELNDGKDGPLCRIWLNDAIIHDGEGIEE
jgi:hypothetical protein